MTNITDAELAHAGFLPEAFADDDDPARKWLSVETEDWLSREEAVAQLWRRYHEVPSGKRDE